MIWGAEESRQVSKQLRTRSVCGLGDGGGEQAEVYT